MAFLAGYPYRKKITIDSSKIDTDLTDFIARVSLGNSYTDDLTTPSMTVIADNDNGSDVKERAFDNNFTSIFATTNTSFPHYIGIDFGASNEKTINAYTITARNDGSWPEAPYTWTLEGSNTGSWSGEEVTLDTRTNEAFVQSETRTFTNFSAGENTTAYRYYRLLVTANQPGSGNTVLGLAEIEFMAIDISGDFDFSKADPSGLDIRFTEDDETTLLYYDREAHDSGDAVGEYHVRIPSALASTDTEFYIYYGYGSGASDGADPTNTWENLSSGEVDYNAVWHLIEDGDGTLGEFLDATSNNHDGQGGAGNPAGVPTRTNSIIYKGQNFDGGDYIQISDSSSLELGSNDFTISFKVRFNSVAGNQCFLGRATSGTSYFYLAKEGGNLRFRDYNSGNIIDFSGAWSPVVDTWYDIEATRNGTSWNVYVDGVSIISTTSSATLLDRSEGWQIGANTVISYFCNAIIDEVRFTIGADRGASYRDARIDSDNKNLLTFGAEEESVNEVIETKTLEIGESKEFQESREYSETFEIGESSEFKEAETTESSDTLEIGESIELLEEVGREETFQLGELVEINQSLETIEESESFDIGETTELTSIVSISNASKIIHYNPLVVITDTNPVKLAKVDISDPENPSFTFYIINASGESVRNAKGIVFNDTFDYLYIACADGQILKVDTSDFNNREQIDTGDSDDLLHIATLSAFDKVYASTDHSTGEILILDNALVDKINTDFRFIIDVQKSLRTNLGLLNSGTLSMDFRFFSDQTNSLNTDFRFLAHDFDDVPLNLISRLDFDVKINGSSVDDVDLSSINIRHQIGVESTATFRLARKHDELDKKLDGSSSQITNQNSVEVYIDGRLEFSGNVAQIQAQSETETVVVVAYGTEKTDKRNTVNLPMSSLDETLHPYHVLLHDPVIINPIIDANDEDPDYYLGIKVDLGEQIKQRNLQGGASYDIPYQFLNQEELDEQKRLFKKGEEPYSPIDPDDSDFEQSLRRSFNEFLLGLQTNFITKETQSIDGFTIGTTAAKIEHGLFKPIPNWTYFWGGVIAKHFDTDTVVSANYVGTSLSGYTSDLWQLIQVRYKSQLTLDDEVTELGEYTVGSAPYKEVSTENGKLIPKSRYEDSESALISVIDKHYDYEDYAKQIAALEYEKLLTTAGTILPKTSAIVELMIDGYYYYGLSLLNRINIVNTTTSGIYSNDNGFPISIKTIEISSESMRVTLTCDNSLSLPELQEIDDRYPDPDSDEFITEEKRYFISAKYDPSRMQEIESTDDFLNQFV